MTAFRGHSEGRIFQAGTQLAGRGLVIRGKALRETPGALLGMMRWVRRILGGGARSYWGLNVVISDRRIRAGARRMHTVESKITVEFGG